MSADEQNQETSASPNVDATEAGPDSTPGGGQPDAEASEKMHELLGELRAEVARLKAHQAKQQAANWIQRRPFLAVALASTLGAAAGYGVAASRRTQPTLSDQAKERLRELAGEARRVAGDVGRELTDRAARSGREWTQRAQEAGRRVAEEAGKAAVEEARHLAQKATERARDVSGDAGERVKRATDAASERVKQGREKVSESARDVKSQVAETAKKAGERAGSMRDAVSEVDQPSWLKQTLWSVAGLTVAGYVASKLRDSR